MGSAQGPPRRKGRRSPNNKREKQFTKQQRRRTITKQSKEGEESKADGADLERQKVVVRNENVEAQVDGIDEVLAHKAKRENLQKKIIGDMNQKFH